MDYTVKRGRVLVYGLEDFSVAHTLECGQCFRFEKIEEDAYFLLANGRAVTIRQGQDHIVLEGATEYDFHHIWRPYFDWDRDYSKIKKRLGEKDSIMKEAISYAPGIRILNQEPFECMLSFILSQNSNIPKIQRAIEALCARYGEPLGMFYGKMRYQFPTPQALAKATEEDYRQCKAGFRGKYLQDAVKKWNDGGLREILEKQTETDKLREILMTVKGIGPKVGDCIALFSWGRREVFPVDVWIKRVVTALYFHGENVSLKEIQKFAAQLYGPLAGYAQQYLFHFGKGLGRKK